MSFFFFLKRLPTWQLSESAWSEHIWTIIRNPWTLPLGNVCQVAYLHSLKLTNVEGNMRYPKRKGSYSNPSIFRCKLAVNFKECAFQKRTSLFFSQGTWPVSRPTISRIQSYDMGIGFFDHQSYWAGRALDFSGLNMFPDRYPKQWGLAATPISDSVKDKILWYPLHPFDSQILSCCKGFTCSVVIEGVYYP